MDGNETKLILSIVIASYNYGRFIEAAIQSVASQMSDEIELIVVDGGSTDNSVDIIKKYARERESVISYWVSEPDKGQSDAFNKGFAKARGKYLTWLNADDIMPDGCLKKVITAFKKHPESEWFTGNVFRFLEDGRVSEIGWGPHFFPAFLQRKNSPSSIAVFGPSTFFSKKIYEQVGQIDVNLVNTMDYDLWIKFVMAGIHQRRINCFCWAFRMHEASKSAEYGEHSVSKQVRDMISREVEVIRARSGYHPCDFWRKVMIVWRLLDGSMFRLMWYRLTLKRIDQRVAAWRSK